MPWHVSVWIHIRFGPWWSCRSGCSTRTRHHTMMKCVWQGSKRRMIFIFMQWSPYIFVYLYIREVTKKKFDHDHVHCAKQMSQTPIELSTNCLINTKSLLLTTSQIIDLQLNLVSGQLSQFLEMIYYVTFALKILLYNSINDKSPSLFQIFIIDKLSFFLSFFLFIFYFIFSVDPSSSY